MKHIKIVLLCFILFTFFGINTASAQNAGVESIFKNHINKVVQKVKQAEDPKQKRALLNSSFYKLIKGLNKVEKIQTLSGENRIALTQFKQDVTNKKNELNGLAGFEKVSDSQLNNFADYLQQDYEQANPFLIGAAIGGFFVLMVLLM